MVVSSCQTNSGSFFECSTTIQKMSAGDKGGESPPQHLKCRVLNWSPSLTTGLAYGSEQQVVNYRSINTVERLDSVFKELGVPHWKNVITRIVA